MKNKMVNLIKFTYIASAILFSVSALQAKNIDVLKDMCAELDFAEQNLKIKELDKQFSPYILTEGIWANCQHTKKIVVLLAKETDIKCAISCGNEKELSKKASSLILLGKQLPNRLISGIDIIPNSARSLPFVLTRIVIFDGNEKLKLCFNEIYYVWEKRHYKTDNPKIDNINAFFKAYIDILETYDATNALDCFVPKLAKNF